jgi:O-antigen ligase
VAITHPISNSKIQTKVAVPVVSPQLVKLRLLLLSDQPFFTKDGQERVSRCFIGWFLVAPVLFVTVELSPTAWAISLALALFLAMPSGIKSARSIPGPARALLAFGVLAAASSAWSIALPRSFHAAGVFAAYCFAGIVVLRYVVVLSHEAVGRVWNALEIGCVAGLLFLLAFELYANFSAADWIPSTEHVRTMHKTTLYGLSFAIALLHRQESRRLVFVLVAFAIPTLVLGKTTGINIAILLVLCLYLMPSYRTFVTTAVVVATGFLALLAPFIAAPVYGWLDSIGVLKFDRVASSAGRLDLWQMISPQILNAPLLGHGADTLRVTAAIVGHPTYYDLPDIPSAHNMVFDIWYDLGAVGIGIFLIVLSTFIEAVRRVPQAAQFTCQMFLLAMLIELSVDHRIWLSWVQGFGIFVSASAVICVRSMRTN